MVARASWIAAIAASIALAATTPVSGQEMPAPVDRAVLEAPAPRLVWERVVDIPGATTPDEGENGPWLNMRALGARADGGALIVAGGRAGGAVRLIGVGGDGNDAFSIPLPAPPGMAKPELRSVALNGDGRDRTWVLSTWRPADASDADAATTHLIGVEGREHRIAVRRLPREIRPGRNESVEREARVLRRLRDGSLLAGGTGYFGPPEWWFARFSVNGNLLHESKSKGFLDFVEDARGNEDGGYSLLMVDSASGSQRASTLRRYGADGKLATQRVFEEMPGYGHCAVLTGANTHLRYRDEYERKAPDRGDEFVRGLLLVVDAGGAIVRRVEMGANECVSLRRNGDGIVLVASRPRWGDTPPVIVAGFTPAGNQRWRLDVPSGIVGVEPLADGGMLVARPDVVEGRSVVKLGRYRAP